MKDLLVGKDLWAQVRSKQAELAKKNAKKKEARGIAETTMAEKGKVVTVAEEKSVAGEGGTMDPIVPSEEEVTLAGQKRPTEVLDVEDIEEDPPGESLHRRKRSTSQTGAEHSALHLSQFPEVPLDQLFLTPFSVGLPRGMDFSVTPGPGLSLDSGEVNQVLFDAQDQGVEVCVEEKAAEDKQILPLPADPSSGGRVFEGASRRFSRPLPSLSEARGRASAAWKLLSKETKKKNNAVVALQNIKEAFACELNDYPSKQVMSSLLRACITTLEAYIRELELENQVAVGTKSLILGQCAIHAQFAEDAAKVQKALSDLRVVLQEERIDREKEREELTSKAQKAVEDQLRAHQEELQARDSELLHLKEEVERLKKSGEEETERLNQEREDEITRLNRVKEEEVASTVEVAVDELQALHARELERLEGSYR